MPLSALLLIATLAVALWLSASRAAGTAYEIIRRLPHDHAAYTQGLLFHDGVFYESTGLYGQSTLRKVDPDSGWPQRQHKLPDRYFGEGLTLLNDELFQITWREGKALVYDRETFKLLREFDYTTEGWGLTDDGQRLIMSDGTDRLFFRDPTTFQVVHLLKVTDQGEPVTLLNELEYIDGEIWANIYRTDDIVRIDPKTGQVKARLDFSDLVAPDERNGQEDVLNGIAYDETGKRLFVTGKRYSFVYEVRMREH